MKVTLEKSTERGFSRGERMILIDGVRWGRTIVTHHGMHGTSYTFKQDDGDVITDGDPKRPHPITIRPVTKRYIRMGQVWRPTEELIIEKVTELVKSGKLRDPAAVRAENRTATEKWRAKKAAQEAAQEAALVAKAREALVTAVTSLEAEGLAAILAAMKWAQTQ